MADYLAIVASSIQGQSADFCRNANFSRTNVEEERFEASLGFMKRLPTVDSERLLAASERHNRFESSEWGNQKSCAALIQVVRNAFPPRLSREKGHND